MHRIRTVALACLVVAGGLIGCSSPDDQALVFGTDTKLALDVSGDQTGQTGFTLGYKRSEFVWLPLAAKHSLTHSCMVGSDGKLACTATDQRALATHACAIPTDETAPNATADGRPMLCLASRSSNTKLVGKKNTNEEDAYSVMTSFGHNSDDGRVAISQYLATGFAARTLAEQGGAALVRTDGVSPATARIIEMERSDIDLIVRRVTADSGTIVIDKFKEIVDATAMSDSRKKALQGEVTNSTTPDQLRNILRHPRYSPYLESMANNI